MKSVTLTGGLYFSNIYSDVLYLYPTLMSIFYHLLALVVTQLHSYSPPKCLYISRIQIITVMFLCHLISTNWACLLLIFFVLLSEKKINYFSTDKTWRRLSSVLSLNFFGCYRVQRDVLQREAWSKNQLMVLYTSSGYVCFTWLHSFYQQSHESGRQLSQSVQSHSSLNEAFNLVIHVFWHKVYIFFFKHQTTAVLKWFIF